MIENKLVKLYSGNPYGVFNETSFKNVTSGEGASLYGELCREGAETILSRLNLEGLLDHKTILYDLGSGLGRLIMHACIKYPISATGIEFSKERYKYSIELCKKLNITNASFINDDYFKCDITNATLIFIDDTYQKLPKAIPMFNNCLLPDEFTIVSTTDIKRLFILKEEKLKVMPDTKQIVISDVAQTYNKSRVFYAYKMRSING